MAHMVYLVYEGKIMDCLPIKLFETICDEQIWYTLGAVYDVAEMDDMEYVCTNWEDWKEVMINITNGGYM